MTLGPQFQLPAGPPVAVTANVRDDCNNPFNAGSVTVAFSNGDLPLSLQPLGDGQWETTWLSSHAASRVTLTVTASDPATKLVGTKQVIGDLLAEQDPPQFDRSGVVSSASTVSFVPLAPGGLFTIYGARLADSAESYKSTPLPTTLGNAVVVMAGQVLPLLFAGPTQINAVVPSGININTTQQVLVQRGLTYSTPASVDLAPAQPAVFLSGGLAIAVAYRSDGTTPFLVSTASPARVGDVLVLYCAGLGATTPAASDGLPAPSAATKDPVSVTIGGRSAPVAFGGLVAGFVGLYQVNTTVPEGAGVGDAVPVVLTVSGQTGAAAPLPIR
jgi:uncharacterized protein (TIGR03437 family)